MSLVKNCCVVAALSTAFEFSAPWTLAADIMAVAESPPGAVAEQNWGRVLIYEIHEDAPATELAVIPAELLSDPYGIAFSPWGELFVGNRHGNSGQGSVSRFLIDAAGTVMPNPIQPTVSGNGLARVHGLAFSYDGELFAANLDGTISRFALADMNVDAIAVPNGSFTVGEPFAEWLAFSSAGDLYVSTASSRVYRFGFGAVGEALPLGCFQIIPGDQLRGLAFNHLDEMFVARATGLTGNRIYVLQDHAVTGVSCTSPAVVEFEALGNPQGLAFSQSGELIWTRHGPLSSNTGFCRWRFDVNGLPVESGPCPDGESVSLGGVAVLEIPVDTDGDGIPDAEDACPTSLLDAFVAIDDCTTDVGSLLFDDGCTMRDLIEDCAASAYNHGTFVSCVADLTNAWKQDGLITGREKGQIQSCAAQSDLGYGCLDHSDCDDGVFCNGVEMCLEGECVTGDPCLGQACDEVMDECVE